LESVFVDVDVYAESVEAAGSVEAVLVDAGSVEAVLVDAGSVEAVLVLVVVSLAGAV
jgi:hypothetical protein